MIPFRITSALGLLVVCMLLVAGCTVSKTEDGRVAIEYGIDHRIVSPPILSTTPIPTTSQIQSAPVQPSIFWIKIDPISDKQVGEIFTINSTTNLSVGDEILVQVYVSHFHLVPKNSVYEFSGATDTMKVIPGRNGTNIISYTLNSTGFNTEEYQITEDAIYQDSTGNVQSYATGEARFNITPRKTS
jgi:hypothetical protein